MADGHENWCSWPYRECTCNGTGEDPFEDEEEDEE